MLYPKIDDIKKKNIQMLVIVLITILLINILLVINVLVDKSNHWSILCIAGIIYLYLAVIYTKKRNINIASNVFGQSILGSALFLAIDYFTIYRGWSVNIAIPITIIIANMTLMVLTIVSRKRYIRYAIYHILTFMCSMIPIILMIYKIVDFNILTILATGIAGFSMLLTLILCGKDIWQDTSRKLHM